MHGWHVRWRAGADNLQAEGKDRAGRATNGMNTLPIGSFENPNDEQTDPHLPAPWLHRGHDH